MIACSQAKTSCQHKVLIETYTEAADAAAAVPEGDDSSVL